MASTIRIAILANGTQAKREFKDVSVAAEKSGVRIKEMGKNLARVTGVIAGTASAIGPLTTGILAAAKGVAVLGKALSAGGATAAAFGPSVAGAFGLIKGTALIAAPAIVKAFEPVISQFRATDKETGALAKRVQDLATRGLKPLAEQFVKVNLPTIGSAMERIGKAMNGVLVSTGKWINSTAGQSLIRTISEGTASAMEKLAPKVSAVVIAFGNLANRAGDGAITGLADVIGRILDKMTEWANSTSAEDIKGSLSALAGFGQKVKDAFLFLRDVGQWMQENQGKVKALSDALGVLGIALAIFAGGPVIGAVIGALSILINHWDDVRGAFEGAKAWWDETWKSLNANANFAAFKKSISDFIAAILPPLRSMWEQIQKEVAPKIQALKDTIMNDVLPALTSFIDAMRPIVAFLIEKLGPVVATTFGAIVTIIQGALKIVSGIINIFTGILTGNWSKVWEGIKQILRGAWDVIVAIVKIAWTRVKSAVDIGIGALKAVLTGIGGKIKGWVGDLGGILVGAGRKLIDGFVSAITGGFGRVRDTLGRLTSFLPDWKGPAQRDRKLLVKPGQLVMDGFLRGLESQYAAIRSSLGGFTGSLAVPASASVALNQSVDLNAQAAALNSKTQVAITFDTTSTGDPLMDAIFEGLRKKIRVNGGNVQTALGRG